MFVFVSCFFWIDLCLAHCIHDLDPQFLPPFVAPKLDATWCFLLCKLQAPCWLSCPWVVMHRSSFSVCTLSHQGPGTTLSNQSCISGHTFPSLTDCSSAQTCSICKPGLSLSCCLEYKMHSITVALNSIASPDISKTQMLCLRADRHDPKQHPQDKKLTATKVNEAASIIEAKDGCGICRLPRQ